MTPEQQAALDRFFKDINGKVAPEVYEKAKLMLDPSKPEFEPLLTALSTGLNNSYQGQTEINRRLEEAANQRKEAQLLREEFLAKTSALQEYKDYLEQNAVSANDYYKAQQEIQRLEAEVARAQTNLPKLEDQDDVDEFEQNMTPEEKQRYEAWKASETAAQRARAQNPPAQPPTPKEAPFKHLTEEQYVARAEQQIQGTLLESAKQAQMMAEHQALTGQPLDIVGISQEALAAGKLPSQYWEEKFEIGKLRQAKMVELRNQEIQIEAQKIAAKMRSEERMTGLHGYQNKVNDVYQIAAQERQNMGENKFIPGQASANAVAEAVAEYESIMATGKLTDGMPVQQAGLVYR